MKPTIAIGCVLLAVSSAKAQFTYLSANRSVFAEAEVEINDPTQPTGVFYDLDQRSMNSSDLGQFDSIITAAAGYDCEGCVGLNRITAEQSSLLASDRIIAEGSVHDLLVRYSSFGGSARGTSSLETEFSVAEPVRVRFSAEALWWDTPNDVSMFLNHQGRVSYRLSGFETSIGLSLDGELPLIPPTSGASIPLHLRMEEFLLPPAIYRLEVFAETGKEGGDVTTFRLPVNYRVQLEVIPIPEPATFGLVLLTLAISAVSERERFCQRAGATGYASAGRGVEPNRPIYSPLWPANRQGQSSNTTTPDWPAPGAYNSPLRWTERHVSGTRATDAQTKKRRNRFPAQPWARGKT